MYCFASDKLCFESNFPSLFLTEYMYCYMRVLFSHWYLGGYVHWIYSSWGVTEQADIVPNTCGTLDHGWQLDLQSCSASCFCLTWWLIGIANFQHSPVPSCVILWHLLFWGCSWLPALHYACLWCTWGEFRHPSSLCGGETERPRGHGDREMPELGETAECSNTLLMCLATPCGWGEREQSLNVLQNLMLGRQ